MHRLSNQHWILGHVTFSDSKMGLCKARSLSQIQTTSPLWPSDRFTFRNLHGGQIWHPFSRDAYSYLTRICPFSEEGLMDNQWKCIYMLHKPKQYVRLDWLKKQENKESMTFVLVNTQHHKRWVILLFQDYHIPKRICQTGKFSLHKDDNNLPSIHAKQSWTKLLCMWHWYSPKLVNTHKHVTEHNMTCC